MKKSTMPPLILLGVCLLMVQFVCSQWQPGQAYDINQEKYSNHVLWQTDKAIFSDIRINEYRGYHHILASFHDNTYIVYIGYDWRPKIVKVSDDGHSVEAYLDDEDYHILENDSHQFFAIGIDENGYIHVFGDMHNFPERNSDHLPDRYGNAKCMYWRSDHPEDISSFTWLGDRFGNCPWGTSFTYPHIFYDQQGRMYFSARVRSDTGTRYAAANYNRYNTVTRQWELIGAMNEYGNRCLFYEDNGEGGGTYSKPCRSLHFDLNNKAHFASSLFNSNREKPFPENNSHYNTDLVYAASDDFGESFLQANGMSIETLPMRIDVAAQRSDVILTNTLVKATASEVMTDYTGTPFVIGDEYEEDGTFRHFCFVFDSVQNAWDDISDQRPQAKGYIVADRTGAITFFERYTNLLHRFFAFGKARVVDPGFFDMCVDRRHLLETGNIRGIPKRTDASQPFQLVEVKIDRPASYPVMGDCLSADAELLSLSADTGIIYPMFTSDIHNYTLYVSKGTTQVNIAATAKHPRAVISGDGMHENIPGRIFITVTAEDGISKLDYSVNIVETDIRMFLPTGDVYIRGGDYSSINHNDTVIRIKTADNEKFQREGLMKFSAGGMDTESINAVFLRLSVRKVKGAGLTRFFNCGTDWDETTLTWDAAALLPTDDTPFCTQDISASDDGYYVWVNQTGYVKGRLASGSGFGFRMVSDTKANDYQILSKEYGDPDQQPVLYIIHGGSLSDDASLVSLTADKGTLVPVFSPGINHYTLEVPLGTDSVRFLALASHQNATVTGASSVSCRSGQVRITVTAEDGVTTSHYTIEITGYNTGLIKNRKETGWRVYPNPATDHVYLEYAEGINGTVVLRNMLGQAVSIQKISSRHQFLDLNGIKSGMYFLMVVSGKSLIHNQVLIINRDH